MGRPGIGVSYSHSLNDFKSHPIRLLQYSSIKGNIRLEVVIDGIVAVLSLFSLSFSVTSSWPQQAIMWISCPIEELMR